MLIYSVPFAAANAKSDTCLPFIGPSNLSAVRVPLSDTPILGEPYLKNVSTMGPFSPGLPRCACHAVTPVMFVAFIL
jgi:hypothetical protein